MPLFSKYHEWSAVPISAYSAPWATGLLSRCMLDWWRACGSTAREDLSCIHPFNSEHEAGQVERNIFKSSVWLDRGPIPANQLQWFAVYPTVSTSQ